MALGVPLGSGMGGRAGGWSSAGTSALPQNAGPPVSERTQRAPAGGGPPPPGATSSGVANLLAQFGPTPNRGQYPGMQPGTQPGAPGVVGSLDWMLQQVQAASPEGQAQAMSEWLRSAMGLNETYFNEMSEQALRQGQFDSAYYGANDRNIGANANLSRRGLGLDRTHADNVFGNLQRDNSAQRGLAGQRNATQQWLNRALGGHNTRDRDLAMRQIALTLFNQDRGLRSSATARGAYNAPGLGIDLDAVNQQADIGRGQANLSYGRTADQLRAGGEMDANAYQTALANLAAQLASGREGHRFAIGQQGLAGEQIGLNASHQRNQNAYAGQNAQQQIAEQLARIAAQRGTPQLATQQQALTPLAGRS